LPGAPLPFSPAWHSIVRVIAWHPGGGPGGWPPGTGSACSMWLSGPWPRCPGVPRWSPARPHQPRWRRTPRPRTGFRPRRTWPNWTRSFPAGAGIL